VTPAGWITLLGIVTTTLVSLFGAVTSARATRRAAERSAELAKADLQMKARDAQIASWRTDAEALRRERDEDARRCREQIAELRAQIELLQGGTE
jgi:Skp family chaperone for outer membrane proteins